MGVVIFKDDLSVDLFLGKSFGKSKITQPKGSLRSYKEVLEIPRGEKSYQVEFDIVFVVKVLSLSAEATKEVPGRKEQQVLRKWIFPHLAKPGMNREERWSRRDSGSRRARDGRAGHACACAGAVSEPGRETQVREAQGRE